MSLPPASSAAAIVATLRPGMTVYVPGMSGESLAFYQALKVNSQAANGVRFVGVHFPGVNHSDYLGLHPRARQRAYFMHPALRAGLADRRAELMPFDYPGIFRDLSENVDLDIAVAQLTPPDEHGVCSLGPCVDFQPALWRKARRRVGHINAALPRTRSSFEIHADSLDARFDEEASIPTYGDCTAAQAPRQAALIADLVRDGDTIECGIGKLPTAALSALAGHRGLRFYSGMVSDPVSKLIDCGAVSGRGAVEVGVVLGSPQFYRRLAGDETFLFRPVSETHDVRRISQIEGFCAINSALQVDLFGQVNVETINGRMMMAGVGGLPAFAAGAHLAREGRSIITLPAASADGKHSRIVAGLGRASKVALPPHQADFFVTEYGVARVKGLSMMERAYALISVAAPQFRNSLVHEWETLAATL